MALFLLMRLKGLTESDTTLQKFFCRFRERDVLFSAKKRPREYMKTSKDNELEELGCFEPGKLPSDNPNPDLRGPFKFGSRRLKEPKNTGMIGNAAVGAAGAGAAGLGAGGFEATTAGFEQQGAAEQGFPQQGFAGQGVSPQGVDTSGLDASGFDASGFAADGTMTAGFDPQFLAAQGFDPQFLAEQGFDPQFLAAQGIDPQFLAEQGIDPNMAANFAAQGFDPNMTGVDPNMAGLDPNMAAGLMNQNFDSTAMGFDPTMAAAGTQNMEPNAWDAASADTTSFEAADAGSAAVEEDSGLEEFTPESQGEAVAEYTPSFEATSPELNADEPSAQLDTEQINNPMAGMPFNAMTEGQDMSEQDTNQNNEAMSNGLPNQAMADPTLMHNAGMMQANMQNPAMMQQAMAQQGVAQQGVAQPGMAQPGMANPGMANPGMMQAGMAQPGMMQPGMMQPGMTGATGMPGEKKTQNIFGQLTEGLKRSVGNSEENQQAEPFLGGLATPGFNSLRVYIAIGLSLLMYGYAWYAISYDDYVGLRWGVATWFCLAALLMNAYTAYQVRQRHESQFVQGLGIAVTVIAAVIFILVLNSYMALETDAVLLERIRATQRDIDDSSTLKLKLR